MAVDGGCENFSIFSDHLWLFSGQVEDSTDAVEDFYAINGSEHGYPSSLTIRDREL